MIRRVVCLLLLPGLLLTQSAMLAHAHDGHEPAGHSNRPHFHLGDSHHDDDHEADAVHVSAVDVLVGDRTDADLPPLDFVVWTAPVLDAPLARAVTGVPRVTHPPPESCPRYLRQLTLLV